MILRKMPLHLAPLSIVLAIALVLSSCYSSKKLAPEAEATPVAPSLLWKISGNGLDTPSYLYGTVHIIPEELFFWPEGVEEALNNTATITLETDVSVRSSFKFLWFTLRGKLYMRNDTTLDMLVDSQSYREIIQTFSQNNLKNKELILKMVNRLKPIFTSQFLYMLEMDGESRALSYERELAKIAREFGFKLDKLERISEVLGILDSIPYRHQAKLLVESIRSSRDSTVVLYKLYRQQDIEGLHSLIIQEADSKPFVHWLLHYRNRMWIPRMERQMRKGPVFFAVGAGHLAGKNGLIALLRKRGYSVTPMRKRVKF